MKERQLEINGVMEVGNVRLEYLEKRQKKTRADEI